MSVGLLSVFRIVGDRVENEGVDDGNDEGDTVGKIEGAEVDIIGSLHRNCCLYCPVPFCFFVTV